MTIDISKFCGGGFPRAWREGDTVYATNDGRIAVAVPHGDAPYSETTRRVVNVEAVLGRAANVSEWIPLPDFPLCEKCGGSGIVAACCRTCRGLGEHTCDCGHFHACQECDGKCEFVQDCGCYVEFARHRVATRYANLIRTLRDVQWGVVGEDALGPVYFRWPRGRGAVATIRQDGDQ